MEEAGAGRTEIIGRVQELEALRNSLEEAFSGRGVSILMTGEAGMGKTRLVEEFIALAGKRGAKVLYSASEPDSARPFQLYSSALKDYVKTPLFEEQEYRTFAKIFVVNRAGLLLAQSSLDAEGGMDADIFAGMLSAVQDFVRDSFDSSGQQKAGLGRLEYGDMKVLIEHGQKLFLTAVVKGQEHADMTGVLKRALCDIENRYGHIIDNWSGQMRDVDGIRCEVESLASRRFLIRKELEGLKLDSERNRISDQVLSHLGKIAGEDVMILVLEDLHWADDSSLFVTTYLARNIRNRRMLLLGTARQNEGTSFQVAMKRMREEGIIQEREMPSLAGDEVSELVQTLCPGHAFPDAFLGTLSERSGGNPFFIREMLWQMEQDGGIRKGDGGYALVTEASSVPSSVDSIVQRRLESLEPDAMAMVEYASCIGREFGVDVLTSIKSVGNSTDALDKLKASGILRLLEGHAEFSHALFQEITYSGIGGRWKQIYHRGIGEHYESAYAGRTEEALYELARHFSRSGDREKGYGYCVKAAEKAEGAYAAEQAISFYNNALELLGKSGSGAELADLLGRMGDLYGLVSRFEDSISSCRRAMEVETEPRCRAELHRKMADDYLKMSQWDNAITECDVGLSILPENEESAERARLLLMRGWCHGKKGEYDGADSFFRQGLELAGKLGLRKEMADALHNLGTMNWYRGDFDLALENLEEAMKIREELGDPRGLANTMGNLGSVHHLRGDLDKAFPLKIRSYELYEKIGEKFGMAAALNNIGISYFHKGDFPTCLEYYNRSLDIRRQIGDLSGMATIMHNIGAVLSVNGDNRKAIEHFTEGLAINRKIGSKLGMIYDLCSLAEDHLTLGNHAESMRYAEEAFQISSEIGALAEEGWARRIIGKNHRAAGRFGEAMKEMARSLEIAEETQEKEEILKSLCDLGLLFRDMGEIGTARDHLERSLAMAKEIDDAILTSMVEEAMREL